MSKDLHKVGLDLNPLQLRSPKGNKRTHPFLGYEALVHTKTGQQEPLHHHDHHVTSQEPHLQWPRLGLGCWDQQGDQILDLLLHVLLPLRQTSMQHLKCARRSEDEDPVWVDCLS